MFRLSGAALVAVCLRLLPVSVAASGLRSRDACVPDSSSDYAAELTFVGCYTDIEDDGQTLAFAALLRSSDLTPQLCGNICGAAGYAYAGVEYGR